MEERKRSFWDNIEEKVMLIPLALAVILTLLSLVMKFTAGKEAAALVEQLSYYSYGWICSLCLAVCARDRSNMKVALLEKKLPEKAQNAMRLASDLVILFIMIGMLYGTFQVIHIALAENAMNSKAANLPLSIGYFAPTVGFAAGIVRHVQSVWKGGKRE